MDPAMDLDFDLGYDINSGLDPLPAEGPNLSSFNSLGNNLSPAGPSDEGGLPVADNRPYHTKRPHKKSRAGCKQCKTRKVKCDEGRPSCRNCTLRREMCVYPEPPPRSAKAHSNSPRSPRSPGSPKLLTPAPSECDANKSIVVAEPIFRPASMGDLTDMKMLWFYTTTTFHSFSIDGGHSDMIDNALKVRVVEHAFTSPFLMQCILGLSSMQMQILNQPIAGSTVVSYRTKAFQGYRDAIEAARPQDYPALLACSLLMCALSSETFREPESRPLYIVDWMTVWRGIGLIVDIITPMSITDSGLSVLFYRPPINLEITAKYIPNNLLFMVQSIKPGDTDYEDQQIYYETLRYLGSLYLELEKGFSPIMDLRIITFLSFMPRAFIPLAKEHRPRALIILAHYCAFTKLLVGPWWMLGIADRQIKEVREAVGESWSHLLLVPEKVTLLEDKVAIAKEILDNDTWTAPNEDLYRGNTRDPRIKDLELINNVGAPAKIIDGHWIIEPAVNPPELFDALKIEDEVPKEQPSSKINFPIGAGGFGMGHPLNTNSTFTPDGT